MSELVYRMARTDRSNGKKNQERIRRPFETIVNALSLSLSFLVLIWKKGVGDEGFIGWLLGHCCASLSPMSVKYCYGFRVPIYRSEKSRGQGLKFKNDCKYIPRSHTNHPALSVLILHGQFPLSCAGEAFERFGWVVIRPSQSLVKGSDRFDVPASPRPDPGIATSRNTWTPGETPLSVRHLPPVVASAHRWRRDSHLPDVFSSRNVFIVFSFRGGEVCFVLCVLKHVS